MCPPDPAQRDRESRAGIGIAAINEIPVSRISVGVGEFPGENASIARNASPDP